MHVRLRTRPMHLPTLLAAAILLGLLTAGARGDSDAPMRDTGSGLRKSPDPGPPLRVYAIMPPYAVKHDVGQLSLQMTNLGIVGNIWIDEPSAGWRDGEYLALAGLWIGAIASDNLSYVSTGAYDLELRPSLEPVDQMYASYEGIPGGNRIGFSAQPDDDDDGWIDEDRHNGKDDDGDGAIDEDFSAISEQMYSCEYWDYTVEAQEAYPEHRPLNVKVRQRSFAWSVTGIDEFVGVEFTIVNEGFEVLRELYLGLYVDSDVGPSENPQFWNDDGGYLVSVDTTVVDFTITECETLAVHIDMPYMYDIPDDGIANPGGDVEGFLGVLLLDHTTDPFGENAPMKPRLHTCRLFRADAAYPEGDPQNDFERYDLLQQGTLPRRPTGQPGDYRFAMSVGPFMELLPGETLTFTVAFVVGEGYYDPSTGRPDPSLGSDGQPSDHSLLANALRARLVYDGRWMDIDGLPGTGVDGKETCMAIEPGGEPMLWQDPCDSTHTEWFYGDDCADSTLWVDNDCNPCTPNTGHEGCAEGGCETQVHWITRSIPADVRADPHFGNHGGPVCTALRLSPATNPALPPVTLLLDLAGAAGSEVEICDVTGRRLRVLGGSGVIWPAGRHELVWDGRDDRGSPLPSGVYFLRPVGASSTAAGRLVLLSP